METQHHAVLAMEKARLAVRETAKVPGKVRAMVSDNNLSVRNSRWSTGFSLSPRPQAEACTPTLQTVPTTKTLPAVSVI